MSISAYILVVALGASDWACEQDERGMWECDPERGAPLPDRAPERINPQARQSSAPQTESVETAPAPQPLQVAEDVQASPEQVAQAPSQVQDPPPLASFSDNQFVVQVGAFSTRADADRAADQLAISSLMVVPMQRDGKMLYVLLLGGYPDREAATAAGESFRADTGGDFWVRTTESVRMASPVVLGNGQSS